MSVTDDEKATPTDMVVVEGEVVSVTDGRVVPFIQGKRLTDHPVVKSLLRATPKKVRQKRKGPGGMMFTYVPWAYSARVLTETFGPTWSMKVDALEHRALPPGKRGKEPREEIIARIRIITPFGEMPGTGSGIYYPENAEQNYGDVEQTAVSYALRRAAARWGIALDLYAATTSDEEETAAVSPDVDDAKAAWRGALSRKGLTEKAAVRALSELLAGDGDSLLSLQDCLDATGVSGAEAYWMLIDAISGRNADGTLTG